MDENTTQDIQDTVSLNDAVTDDKVDDNNLINGSEKEETFNIDSTDYFTLVPELSSEVVTKHYGIVEMRLENLEVLGICISVGIGLLVGILSAKSFFDFMR